MLPLMKLIPLVTLISLRTPLPNVDKPVKLDAHTTISFPSEKVAKKGSIGIVVNTDGKKSRQILDGLKDWNPTDAESMESVDFDKVGKVALVRSSSSHGGSGSRLYLHAVRKSGTSVITYRLDSTMENIHSGEFLLAISSAKTVGMVVTEPLMDNKVRAEPTRWRVKSYRLLDTGFKLVKTGKTVKSYSEKLPADAIKEFVPDGWTVEKSKLP